MFKNTIDNKRYYTLNCFYKNKFNCKVCKISLNANFSCPNKDGKVGYGGCVFCSKLGSGDFAGDVTLDLVSQFEQVKGVMTKKWTDTKFIGYFQANTNTYANVETLRNYYETILNLDNVVGLNIATRPDAISEDVMDYLSELNKKTFLTVELGLQSIHNRTLKYINRGHDLECFVKCFKKLKEKNINVVVHIINGLPYETEDMMIDTVKFLNNLGIDGIKIHMLHILKNTKLADLYEKEKFHILSKNEYIDIVIKQLEYLNPNIVIHRITGDPDVKDLIEPDWLVKKFCVLNDIDKEMVRRNTYQGIKK